MGNFGTDSTKLFEVSVRKITTPSYAIWLQQSSARGFCLKGPPDRSFAFAQVVTFLKNVAKVTLVRLGDCVRLGSGATMKRFCFYRGYVYEPV